MCYTIYWKLVCLISQIVSFNLLHLVAIHGCVICSKQLWFKNIVSEGFHFSVKVQPLVWQVFHLIVWHLDVWLTGVVYPPKALTGTGRRLFLSVSSRCASSWNDSNVFWSKVHLMKPLHTILWNVITNCACISGMKCLYNNSWMCT